MSERINVVIQTLESDAPTDDVAELEVLLVDGVNAADPYAVEREKSRELGADTPDYAARKAELDAALAEINAHPNFEVDWIWLIGLYGWSSTEEMALTWAISMPAPLTDLTEREIEQLLEATDRNIGTLKLDRYLRFLEESLPTSFSTNLIFWPHTEWASDELPAKELAAEIVIRRSLFENGGEAAVNAHELAQARATLAEGTASYPVMRQAADLLPPEERKLHEEMLSEILERIVADGRRASEAMQPE